jgi:N6-L-threonylcarbamoyladenine synthase
MSERRLILGIESSCDETSAAVVADGRDVLSNVVASQIELHSRYGGVVPEIASRAHIEAINSVIEQAMSKAAVTPGDLSAVAVTGEPGLIGSLLVGAMAAKTLAWVYGRPLVSVNHVYAHAYAAALDADAIEYPAAALVCSGGHTALYRCESPTEMELLGTTIDDAAGEAFDKVASILELGYPGGPVIDKAAREGNADAIDFPRSLLHGASLDFSFSGLKTAVLYHVRGVPGRKRGPDGNYEPPAPPRSASELSPREKSDIAASFQAAVVDVLRIKLRRAAKLTGAKTLLLGGGVAANSALRAALTDLAGKLRCTLRMPPMKFCTDNAAMIAALGYHYLRAGRISDLNLDVRATVRR